MIWKRLIAPLLCLAAGAWPSAQASSPLGSQNLPDLSSIAGAIEKSVTAPAPAKGTLYHSGLTVPSVNPGATARGIGRQLRESIEQQTGPKPGLDKLESGMPQALLQAEELIESRGFAKRDLGVAAGVFFLENWETATQKTLSDATEAAALRSVAAAAAAKWKGRYQTLTPAAQEKTYESLLLSTLLLNAFAGQFDKAGKTQEAAGMRQAAGALFQKVIGVPPAQVKIDAQGRITGLASGQKPAASAPPSLKPGSGVKPSQIAGVYAEPSYGGGAGGFVSVSYEPVLALKDGTYCKHFEVPPSDLDAAASRRRHPEQWGRWRGGGTHTETLSEKGAWEKSGWIGPLPGAGPGLRLSGKYTHVSGGGTLAAGGDVMVAFQNSLTFLPDGHFRSGSTTSASSNAVVAGSSRNASGTYTVSGYAITMRFQDGTVQRWSYARTADGLLFLHGDAFTN